MITTRSVAWATKSVTTLWSGNLLDPHALLSLVRILQIIRDEIDHRQDMIGNWLYCLRNSEMNTEVSRTSKRQRVSGLRGRGGSRVPGPDAGMQGTGAVQPGDGSHYRGAREGGVQDPGDGPGPTEISWRQSKKRDSVNNATLSPRDTDTIAPPAYSDDAHIRSSAPPYPFSHETRTRYLEVNEEEYPESHWSFEEGENVSPCERDHDDLEGGKHIRGPEGLDDGQGCGMVGWLHGGTSALPSSQAVHVGLWTKEVARVVGRGAGRGGGGGETADGLQEG